MRTPQSLATLGRLPRSPFGLSVLGRLGIEVIGDPTSGGAFDDDLSELRRRILEDDRRVISLVTDFLKKF